MSSSLRVVFANGEIAELGCEPLACFDDEPAEFKDVVVRKLRALVRRSGEATGAQGPQVAPQPRRLRSEAGPRGRGDRPGAAPGRLGGDARPGDRGDVLRPCRSRRRPGRWPSCRSAGSAMPPSAPCSTVSTPSPRSATSTTGGRSAWCATPVPAFREWIAEAAEAVLIVEFEGDDPDEVARQVRQL